MEKEQQTLLPGRDPLKVTKKELLDRLLIKERFLSKRFEPERKSWVWSPNSSKQVRSSIRCHASENRADWHASSIHWLNHRGGRDRHDKRPTWDQRGPLTSRSVPRYISTRGCKYERVCWLSHEHSWTSFRLVRPKPSQLTPWENKPKNHRWFRLQKSGFQHEQNCPWWKKALRIKWKRDWWLVGWRWWLQTNPIRQRLTSDKEKAIYCWWPFQNWKERRGFLVKNCNW